MNLEGGFDSIKAGLQKQFGAPMTDPHFGFAAVRPTIDQMRDLYGPHARPWATMLKEKVVELHEVLVLEEQGVRDGDGTWHGTDPIAHLVGEINKLCEADTRSARPLDSALAQPLLRPVPTAG